MLAHTPHSAQSTHARAPDRHAKAGGSADDGDISVAACGSLEPETRCFAPESLPVSTRAKLCVVPDVPADIVCAFTARTEESAPAVCGVAPVPGVYRLSSAVRCMSLRVGPSGGQEGHLLAACRAVDAELLAPLGVTPIPVDDGDVPVGSAGASDLATDDAAAVAAACSAAVRLLGSALALARVRTSTVCGIPSAAPCKAAAIGAVVERLTLCHALAARTVGSGTGSAPSSTAADAVARVAMSLRQHPLHLVRVVNAVTVHLRPGGAADGAVSTTMLAAMQKFALSMLPAGGVRDVSSFFECVCALVCWAACASVAAHRLTRLGARVQRCGLVARRRTTA